MGRTVLNLSPVSSLEFRSSRSRVTDRRSLSMVSEGVCSLARSRSRRPESRGKYVAPRERTFCRTECNSTCFLFTRHSGASEEDPEFPCSARFAGVIQLISRNSGRRFPSDVFHSEAQSAALFTERAGTAELIGGTVPAVALLELRIPTIEPPPT